MSDQQGQLGEGVGQTEGRTDIGAEIVEAPAEVLDEGVAGDDHPGTRSGSSQREPDPSDGA